jgi:hypothetical protein
LKLISSNNFHKLWTPMISAVSNHGCAVIMNNDLHALRNIHVLRSNDKIHQIVSSLTSV